MKLANVTVTKHRLVYEPGPSGQIAKLELTCKSPYGGTKLVFRVDDTAANRDVWALGKCVDRFVKPVWRFYTALEFHEVTLATCKGDTGQPLYSVRAT